jgi:hypothetical protein
MGIAKEIVAGMNESLRQPLTEISAAVKQVSGNQGDAVNKLLTDTMAAMTAQIRDLFSGQVDGIRGMQQQTIDSLGAAVGRLEQLVADISTKGKDTTEAISARLASTLTSMEVQQRAMSEQTQALVDTMRAQVSKAQADGSVTMQRSMDQMSEAVAKVCGMIQSNLESATARDIERTEQLSEHAHAATSSASHLAKELIRNTAEALTAMRQSVESMRTVTTDTVGKMNIGAAEMLRAANEMGRLGSTSGAALERAQSLVEQLVNASGALSQSTGTLNKVIDDYKETRDSLALMVQQLNATVEIAKRETSLTADILRRIEASAEHLKEAQLQADDYLKGISEVLTSAHQQFGTQIISTLDSVNGEFHKHVERGTRALAGAIDELDQVISRVGS